jgi:glycine oxidase
MISVVIIGAGIIGLSIGWQLAREKMDVSIIEQKKAGQQASFAAAGMLAPFCESTSSHPVLLEWGRESLSLYPRFLEELQEDISCPLPVEKAGTLCIAMNRDDMEWLRRRYDFMKKHQMPVHWLSENEVRRKEPLLSPRVCSGIWIPEETHVDNRLLLQSLNQAFAGNGGKLVEQDKIVSLHQRGKTFQLISEKRSIYQADVVINSGGAWAHQIIPNEDLLKIGLRPVKGQIISLKMPLHLSLKNMVRTPRVYLAPKQSGMLRIGATSEDCGFNEEITAGAVLELLQNAWEAIPSVSECTFSEIAASFRPVTNTSLPWIGPSSLPGLFYAVGHGRSGILLAPYTAYVIKELIKNEYSHGN